MGLKSVDIGLNSDRGLGNQQIFKVIFYFRFFSSRLPRSSFVLQSSHFTDFKAFYRALATNGSPSAWTHPTGKGGKPYIQRSLAWEETIFNLRHGFC
jgi:hypothetical protein